MTISLKANLDGISGTIQVDSVDVLSLASNGNISTTGSVTSGSLSTGAITASGSITTGGIAAEKIKLETAQNTTSGTFVDFTGIPSWVKRITVMFNGVSTNGTSPVQIQLGTTSSVEITNYFSSAVWVGGTNTCLGTTSTTGLLTEGPTGASVTRVGMAFIVLSSNNTWVLQSTQGRAETSNYVMIGGGSKTLSGTLDRIRITTVNGTDTFDAGSVNILLEGY
jgi:hypothetical protein